MSSIYFFATRDDLIEVMNDIAKTNSYEIIYLDRETGKVKIFGESHEDMNKAKDYILNVICKNDKPQIPEFEIGSVIEGTIKRKAPFGMFVEIAPDVEGLLHVSKLNGKSLDDFEEGQKIKVKVLSQSGFKIELALAE